ncbi:MAG: helix-turn-helix domain-containing protein [Parvibaculum sp.]|uniref:GlxA family transcriptional regulator n=1 Tax=Parvibaculum sp. TaxID=2024848 RepID=UPI00349FFBF6
MVKDVSLVAIPEAMASTMSGLYDVLGSLRSLSGIGGTVIDEDVFRVRIVGETRGTAVSASGLSLEIQRTIDTISRTDIVIVPSLLVPEGRWETGRYPELVEWLGTMHQSGAILCSACSGMFLLAETGLFDGADCTIHWSYAQRFHSLFPQIRLHPECALLASGDHADLVSSGASTSWHDLALYLVARYSGVAVAQAATKFFALQWHEDGLAPYIVFSPPTDHGDAVIADAQAWLATHFPVGGPVEEMVARSGLPERTFKRRFSKATGFAPLAYVQRLRIEDARARLERTSDPVDEIAWRVGYEDPAFFRRIFNRTMGLSPGAYRRKFQVPEGAVRRKRAQAGARS